MNGKLHILNNPEELADHFADQLMEVIEANSEKAFHLAISGGKTPDLLFTALANKYTDSPLWQKTHFWWVDERMVPIEDPESNFGLVQRLLLQHILIPEENIHRIKGENDPEAEAISYSAQIKESLTSRNGWPFFDLIVLGIGDDGHTASIFPNQLELLGSDLICEVASHPTTGQKRITLTGKVINNADKVCFLITGAAKARRLSEIWGNQSMANLLPAAHIQPTSGNLEWYIDESVSVFTQ
jgi:6-phosphogluconolactonase